MVQDAWQSQASLSTGGHATGAVALCIMCAKHLKGKQKRKDKNRPCLVAFNEHPSIILGCPAQRQALVCKRGASVKCLLPFIKAEYQTSCCAPRVGLTVGLDQVLDPSIPAVSVHVPVAAVFKFPDCTPVMQGQDLPAAATSPATELTSNSTLRAVPQQQPSAAAATQSVATVPTAITGGTLDVLPSHDLSGPSVSRLMKQVRERQGGLRLKVKGPTMPAPALPTAASLPIGTPGDGQPIRASQKGRQTVTHTELPLSTQPELPLSTQPASLRKTQSGAVHSSPINQIILNEPARSQTHLASGPATEPAQARKQNPQQRSEAAANTAVNPLSSPRGSPLSPLHPLSSPRGSGLSPDSACRQWLLTDSFRQRQATCKESLKAAQQDVLKWLRTNRVVQTHCFFCRCSALRMQMHGFGVVYCCRTSLGSINV